MPKTALHQAASAGNQSAVAALIGNGCQVTCWDKDGWTPLHHACRNHHCDVAEYLIRQGADVNAKNKRKVSPLHESAYRGYADLVELLISEGAAINATDKDGWTPLHAACRQGNVDVVKLLVDADASLSCKSRAGKLPRDYAIYQHCDAIIGLLDTKSSGRTVQQLDLSPETKHLPAQLEQNKRLPTENLPTGFQRCRGPFHVANSTPDTMRAWSAELPRRTITAEAVDTSANTLSSGLNPGANSFIMSGLQQQDPVNSHIDMAASQDSIASNKPVGGGTLGGLDQTGPWFDKTVGSPFSGPLNTLFSESLDSTLWNTTAQGAIGTGRPPPPRVDAIGSPVSFVNGIAEVRRSSESENDGSLQWNMWDPSEVSGAGGASPNTTLDRFAAGDALTAFGALTLGHIVNQPLNTSSGSKGSASSSQPAE